MLVRFPCSAGGISAASVSQKPACVSPASAAGDTSAVSRRGSSMCDGGGGGGADAVSAAAAARSAVVSSLRRAGTLTLPATETNGIVTPTLGMVPFRFAAVLT